MYRAAILFIVLAFAPASAAPPEILATKATLRYPADTSLIVKAKNGAAYRLALEVDPTADGVPSNLTLVLQRAGAEVVAPNLLDPSGNWHGLQPHFFAATDFRNGPAQSQFGATRSLCSVKARLTVEFTVKEVVVDRQNRFAEDQFKTLVVDVALANAPPVGGHAACE